MLLQVKAVMLIYQSGQPVLQVVVAALICKMVAVACDAITDSVAQSVKHLALLSADIAEHQVFWCGVCFQVFHVKSNSLKSKSEI